MAIKEAYEISVWEDIYSTAAYPTEKKIAIIGSNTMTSQCRAHEPKFVKNINGTITFTFKMYYVCSDVAPQDITVDYKNGDNYINPFISLLSNERKIKVKWQDKWYDLVIKNCQEDSSGKTITYTCKDIFINELGKTGFNIELDTELANNNGTVEELANTILEGSDWRIYNQDIIQEKVKESGYVDVLTYGGNQWTVVPDDDNTTSITPSASKPIFLFYSQIPDVSDATSGTINFFQFLFANGSFQTEENENLIINAKSYHIFNVVWEIVNNEIIYKSNNVELFRMSKTPTISLYRGERLVRQQIQEIDSNLNRSVYLYNHATYGDIYGYSTTDYSKNSDVIMSLVVNGTEGTISDSSGWYSALATTGDVESPLPLLCPPFFVDGGINVANYAADGFLRLPKKLTNINTYVVNTGLQENSVAVGEGFTKGEKFIFRYKLINQANTTVSKSSRTYLSDVSKITPHFYAHSLGSYINPMVTTGDLFTWQTPTYNNGWITYIATCNKTISKNSLVVSETYTDTSTQTTKQRQWDLYLQINDVNNYYYIGACEFFKLTYNSGEIVYPGEYGDYTKAYVVTKYYRKGIDPEDTDGEGYLYIAKPDANGNPTTWNEVTPVYKTSNNKYTYESVRTISGKNSNRYNLLQQIAETFECWMDVQINHNDDGTIKYSTVEGISYPEKYIRFVKEIGQYSGLSFTYGLDLKSISRTIASEQIATKTVVAKNSNEYGEDGYCAIGRSIENYPRVNYILNFDYYVEMGLLNSGILNQDLYSNDDSQSSPYIGLYYWLHKYNTEYDSLTDELLQLNATKDKQNAYLTTYQELLKATQQSKSEVLTQLNELQYSINGQKLSQDQLNNDETYQSLLHEKVRLNQLETNYSQLVSNIEDSLEAIEEQITLDEEDQEELIENINAKEQQFYSKYSGYIQEGSWSSEDYYDDTLYYLDAVDVAYTSSRPQVSYTISVIRLSGIEDFQNRKFYLGDICYVQDNDFFGKTKGETYKEQVFISEVTYNFDNPAQDTFKVQNYKTQFEDLFQRITATTQSLQYSTGSYKKAASIVNEDGTIDAETLQASIVSNNKLISSYLNESVSINNQGILISDTTNINHLVKITSGGIFCSIDGGQNWTNAIRGDGISVNLLSSGVINTNKIIISDGSNEAFRWDNHGINAYYKYTYNDEQRIDLGKFVRFDGYGLYGLSDANTAYSPISEIDIWNTAQFGLTWKGFFLKTNYDNGAGKIEISTDNDITLYKQLSDLSYINKIKIGRFDDGHYGITINNDTGSTIITTNEDGELWLKNRLNIGNLDEGTSLVQIGYLNSIIPRQCLSTEAYIETKLYFIKENNNYIAVERLTEETYDLNREDYYLIHSDILDYDYSIDYIENTDVTQDTRKQYYYIDSSEQTYKKEDPTAWSSTKTYYYRKYSSINRVLNSNDKFIVWNNGNVYATNGIFNGEINATSGSIGGIIISNNSIYSSNNNFYLTSSGFLTVLNADISGKITASSGSIGGILINDQGLSDEEGNFNLSSQGLLTVKNANISGVIQASSGVIGGFTIGPHSIYNTHEADDTSHTENLVIQNGYTQDSIYYPSKIIVDYIELGDHATIKNYIQFTDQSGNYTAYIYNPSIQSNKEFIKADNLIIDATGKIKLGYLAGSNTGITLDGTEGSIISNRWSLYPEYAEFQNVNVAGSINTSVLSQGSILNAGSTIICKPSWKINNIESFVDEGNTRYKYYLEDSFETNLNANDFIILTGSGIPKKEQIYGVNSSNKYIILNHEYDITQYWIITLLANYQDNIIRNNFIIGINSTTSSSLLNLFPKSSITMVAPTLEQLTSSSNFDCEPLLLLGDLSSLKINDLQGFGLYSNNVYLNGKLITEYYDSTVMTYYSAGIDTNSIISFNKAIGIEDTSPIIFWGGAHYDSVSNRTNAIQNAPFQISRNGYLYAQNGYFTGTVVSNSIVSNSDIYTDEIKGGELGSSSTWIPSSLILSDLRSSIIFKDKDNTINTEGFKFYSDSDDNIAMRVFAQKDIIQITNTTVNNNKIISVNINTDILNSDVIKSNYYDFINTTNQSTIAIGEKSTGTVLSLGESSLITNQYLSINYDSVSLLINNTYIQSKLILGNTMTYEKIQGSNNTTLGYDLYVLT